MTKSKFLILAALAATTVSACSGGGGSAAPEPPPQTVSTFTVTLSDIDVDRSADQLDLGTGGLPVQGATITITE